MQDIHHISGAECGHTQSWMHMLSGFPVLLAINTAATYINFQMLIAAATAGPLWCQKSIWLEAFGYVVSSSWIGNVGLKQSYNVRGIFIWRLLAFYPFANSLNKKKFSNSMSSSWRIYKSPTIIFTSSRHYTSSVIEHHCINECIRHAISWMLLTS